MNTYANTALIIDVMNVANKKLTKMLMHKGNLKKKFFFTFLKIF